MSLGCERRLDDTVPFGQLGDGESVEVRTKMGSRVTSGQVLSVLPFGVIIRESTGVTSFRKGDLYLFASLESEPPVVATNQLNDGSLDSRVQAKLNAMGEAGDVTPGKTGAKPIDPNASDDEYKDKDGEKDKKGDEPEKKDEKPKEKDDKDKKAVADPDSSIDTEKLPDDIKKAIITTAEMDDAELNGVLSDISDAALKALKRNGIAESELFGLVQKISDSSYQVLTGKKPPKKGD